ncbi:BafA family autotransporter [Bartonella henselae]
MYDDGVALFTDVMSGGEQNLSTWLGDIGGLAVDTRVFAAGVQNVFAGGRANTVTLEEGALQRVYAGGYVETLMINSGANSLVYSGAILEGAVKINGSGKLHLYAGDGGHQTTAEEILLNGKEAQLYSIATEVNGSSSLIGKLSGNGSVIFTSTATSPDSTKLNSYYSLLYVGDLSGSLHFNLRVNVKERYGDYLIIEEGAGDHTVSVLDSGAEIANNSFQSVNLITDKSGNAHFSLKNRSGEKAATIDGGAYMYSLQQKKGNDGEKKIWYLASAEKVSTSLTTSSNMGLPINGSLGKEEDVTVSQDPIVSSYASDFSFYPDDFIMEKEEESLQSSIISEDSVHIFDDGESDDPKWSINTMVEGAGTLYVEAGGFSKNTTIEHGGSEIVAEQGISESTIVYEGGKQNVEGGGVTLKAQIYGGEQLIFGDGYVNGSIAGSSAYNTTIYGQGEIPGYQSVYDDGMAVGTKIMEGGIQTLAKWFSEDDTFAQKSGGLAINTEVFAGGMQRILAGGEADTVTLYTGAVQVVHAGGYVKNLTIENRANSWVSAGAMLEGKITVKDSGQLHLDAGDNDHQTTVEDIDLSGENARLYSISDEFDDKSSYIQKLSGVGEIVFTSAGNDLYYSRLYIDNLSGSMHFNFNVSLAEEKGDYLSIKNGSGYHTISIIDSGIEIANPSSTELDLIVDQSGGAHFTLQNLSGAKVKPVDAGTYLYGLKQKNGDDGNKKIWYLSAVYIDSVQRRGRFFRHLNQNQPISVLSTSLASEEQAAEILCQRGRCRSLRQKPLSSVHPFNAVVGLRKNNIHQNLDQKPSGFDSSTVSISKNQFFEVSYRNHIHQNITKDPQFSSSTSSLEKPASDTSSPTGHYHSSDEQQQSVVSTDGQSLADQMILRPGQQGSSSPQSSQKLSVSHFLTTPSTDAVLSMSVTPALVFHNELQAVRAGRGILDRGKKNTAFWAHAIKSKEHIVADHKDFKLDQTGIVLGVSGVSELMGGEFYIGGFGSYDQARVAHARGGVSGINTYSIGAYATYFDKSGWYLDSILKYNQYQNNLKAVSTNGIAIEGNYNQWGLGTSFEAGYRFETTKSSWMQPYAQLSWLQVEGKEIKLSNEMTGDINAFTSLRSEVGLSAGYEFCLGGDVTSMAYITAAWLRENRDSNRTTINKLHQFVTDLSGNFGKLGIGLSSLVSKKFKLYAEAQYVKGDKVKQSFQGILGVRYSF